jgi:hypothetical protein
MGALPVEPKERARLAGGGDLVLATDADILLRAATRRLSDVAIKSGTTTTGKRLEVQVAGRRPARISVDLRAAKADAPGVVRVFDLAERSSSGRLIGGTTFVTVATS